MSDGYPDDWPASYLAEQRRADDFRSGMQACAGRFVLPDGRELIFDPGGISVNQFDTWRERAASITLWNPATRDRDVAYRKGEAG